MGAQMVAGPVVVAEDDVGVFGPLRDALRAEGVQVVTARQVATALAAIEFHRPSAVLVDLALEDGRGWEVLHAARRHVATTTIALNRAADRLSRDAALAAGADDVLGEPFEPREIAARVLAILRRATADPRPGPVYRHRDLVLDVPAHEVRLGGRPVRLTPQQFAILRALCEVRGAALHRSHLIARIESLDAEPPSDRAVDLHVSRLRRRLGDDARRPRYVEAVPGVGYRLARDDSVAAQLGDRAMAVLDALPDALLVVDDRLRIRFANRSLEGLLERGRETLVGSRCDELLDCRTCEGHRLAGPRCLGRAVLSGNGGLRDVRAVVHGPTGPLPVVFSHVRVPVEGEAPLVAIALRPDPDGPVPAR